MGNGLNGQANAHLHKGGRCTGAQGVRPTPHTPPSYWGVGVGCAGNGWSFKGGRCAHEQG